MLSCEAYPLGRVIVDINGVQRSLKTANLRHARSEFVQLAAVALGACSIAPQLVRSTAPLLAPGASCAPARRGPEHNLLRAEGAAARGHEEYIAVVTGAAHLVLGVQFKQGGEGGVFALHEDARLIILKNNIIMQCDCILIRALND